MLRVIWLFVSVLGISHELNASTVKVSFEVPYSSSLWADFEPSSDDLREAENIAKEKVLGRYISTRVDSSKIDQVEKKRGQLYGMAGDIVNNLAFRGYRAHANRKTVEYVFKARVDDDLFNKILFSGTDKKQLNAGFSFLILPRISDSIEKFDLTIKKRGEAKKGSSIEIKKISSNVNADGVEEGYTAGGSKERAVVSVEQSGSAIKKRNKITWGLGNAARMATQMNRHLVQNGINAENFSGVLSDCGDGGLSIDRLQGEVVESATGEYSTEHTKQIQAALWECEVDYFAKGVVDIHSIERERGGSNKIAQAEVNVVVTRIFAKKTRSGRDRIKEIRVGSMSDNFKGRGMTEQEAIEAATETATKKVVDVILAQLLTQ